MKCLQQLAFLAWRSKEQRKQVGLRRDKSIWLVVLLPYPHHRPYPCRQNRRLRLGWEDPAAGGLHRLRNRDNRSAVGYTCSLTQSASDVRHVSTARSQSG